MKVDQSCPTFSTPWTIYSPRNSLGQNTGMGSLSLLLGIFPTQGSNPGLLHCRRILYQLSHKGSPRILTGMGSLSLLQRIFPNQESNRGWDWGGGRPRRLTFFLLQTGGGWRRRGRVCPWKAGMMCSVTHQCCYEELSSSPDLILLKPCQIAMVWKESTQNCMPNLTGILRFPSILKNLKWTFYKMPQLNYL